MMYQEILDFHNVDGQTYIENPEIQQNYS